MKKPTNLLNSAPCRRAFIALALTATGHLAHAQSTYVQHNLVSDLPGIADHTDANLLNPWGLAFNSTGPFWISDNHSGLSTIYNSTGAPQALVVTIPPPAGGAAPAAPTGLIFNSTTNFLVDSVSPAKFIFATEDGTISAWASGTSAVLKVDNSAAGAIYKGLALGTANGSNYLYASDFHNAKVDVFDGSFNPVWPGAFADTNLPAGFAPFGIALFGTNILVTYAKQDADAEDDVAGPGNGYVDVFDTRGNLLKRLISNGPLDSPWGMTLAPADFGLFANQLLVGNFGNGEINVFDPSSGTWVGAMKDTNGVPVAIEGLWDLKFGNGGSAGATNTLYFTAGIAAGGALEDHGLFGSLALQVTPHTPGSANITVGAGGLKFSPAAVTVNAGDKLIWTWGGNFHSTTSGANGAASGLWDSGVNNAPHSFTNTINTVGTYPYYCSIHFASGMTGSVTVHAANFPPAAFLFSPDNGAVFAAPANVALRATAADSDGSVTNVRFMAGTTILTNQISAPFSAIAPNLAAGNYTLSAIATDNTGATATNSVNITIVTPVDTALTSPALLAGTNFMLSYSVNTGLTYVVQLSTNLATGPWIPLATNTAASNPAVFLDSQATNNPAFYRIVRLPNP